MFGRLDELCVTWHVDLCQISSCLKDLFFACVLFVVVGFKEEIC